MEELQKRLASISGFAVGEYSLSADAFTLYDRWYRTFRDDLESDVQYQGLKARLHLLVLKVALLLRLQRYQSNADRLIDGEDLKDAITIVTRTWQESKAITQEAERPFVERLQAFIRARGEITRSKLLRYGHFTANELDAGLTMLASEGKIEITGDAGPLEAPSACNEEVYRWAGEKWLGTKRVG